MEQRDVDARRVSGNGSGSVCGGWSGGGRERLDAPAGAAEDEGGREAERSGATTGGCDHCVGTRPPVTRFMSRPAGREALASTWFASRIWSALTVDW